MLQAPRGSGNLLQWKHTTKRQKAKTNRPERTREEDCFNVQWVTEIVGRRINHCISASRSGFTVWRLGATVMITPWGWWVIGLIPFSAMDALWGPGQLISALFSLKRCLYLWKNGLVTMDDKSKDWAVLSQTLWHAGQLKSEFLLHLGVLGFSG